MHNIKKKIGELLTNNDQNVIILKECHITKEII